MSRAPTSRTPRATACQSASGCRPTTMRTVAVKPTDGRATTAPGPRARAGQQRRGTPPAAYGCPCLRDVADRVRGPPGVLPRLAGQRPIGVRSVLDGIVEGDVWMIVTEVVLEHRLLIEDQIATRAVVGAHIGLPNGVPRRRTEAAFNAHLP